MWFTVFSHCLLVRLQVRMEMQQQLCCLSSPTSAAASLCRCVSDTEQQKADAFKILCAELLRVRNV